MDELGLATGVVVAVQLWLSLGGTTHSK